MEMEAMKLEEQFCNLELSKRLKELGVKQESYLHWCYNKDTVSWQLAQIIMVCCEEEMANLFSAFTVAELGMLLPYGVMDKRIEKGLWYCYMFHPTEPNASIVHDPADTEADARASLLIYLLEQGLMKP